LQDLLLPNSGGEKALGLTYDVLRYRYFTSKHFHEQKFDAQSNKFYFHSTALININWTQ